MIYLYRNGSSRFLLKFFGRGSSEFLFRVLGGSQTLAAQFTPSGNFNLVDAKVMVTQTPSEGPFFNVWIAADAGGVH